jgi:hypothetical protein
MQGNKTQAEWYLYHLEALACTPKAKSYEFQINH